MHVVILSVSSSNILISSAVQGTHLHQLTHHLHVVCSRGLLCGKRNRLEKSMRDRKLMLTLGYKFSVTDSPCSNSLSTCTSSSNIPLSSVFHCSVGYSPSSTDPLPSCLPGRLFKSSPVWKEKQMLHVALYSH